MEFPCALEKLKLAIKFTFFLFLGFLLALVYLRINEKKIMSGGNQQSSVTIGIDDPRSRILYDNFGFYPVNDRGVYSFWNVCIENSLHPIRFSYENFSYYESKRIAIYDSFYRVGDQRIQVSVSANAIINYWDAIFFRVPLPPTYTFHKITVFFVIQVCPSNFHHFWIDFFVPLFNVVWRANRLKKNSNNQIFFRFSIPASGDLQSTSCFNISRYKKFFDTLYFENDPVVFFKAPTNACYSSAVFGSNTDHFHKPRLIVNHTKNFFYENYIPEKLIKTAKKCSVIIQNRKYRRIKNINILKTIAESLGLSDVCILYYEDISFEEQVHYSSNARMLIGVQGAGLQWAVFMPKGSVLLEIAWPLKHWSFFFERFVTPYGIRHVKLMSHDVTVNWTSYEKMVRDGREVNQTEKLQMLKSSGVKNTFDNLWKWADVNVNIEDFKNILFSFIDKPDEFRYK